MPTPVQIARQCLSPDASTALDDAVSIAKHRSHPQTTSLHAISSLLHQPNSTIQQACSRSTTSVCPPRLQLRALDLCLSVALDRISTVSKPGLTEPPVSNSLMAAIKRAQANQRRHPDTFQLYCNAESVMSVKVEMKHFVLSILDDPLVSRVFGDAGFRTSEVKLAILNPVLPVSRVSGSLRCPPLFKCSLSDVEKDKLGLSFPLSLEFDDKVDENSRRVGEVLVRKDRRNPLLVGSFGSEALKGFLECLDRKESGVVMKEIEGVSVFTVDVRRFDFKEVSEMAENCKQSGVIVNCGDFETFLEVESVVVVEMKRLLSSSEGKMWVIGYLGSDDVYKRTVERFPNIEMDLDLHLLPITSLTGTKRFKSSLMGSFVPLGGFFSLPSDLETVHTTVAQSSSLCNSCKKKYETEVSTITEGTPISSIPNSDTVNFSSWLNITRGETSNKSDGMEAKDYNSVLDARVRAAQRKWNDICQRLHSYSINEEDISESNSQMWRVPSSFINRSNTTSLSHRMPLDSHKSYPPMQNYPKSVLLLDDVAAEIPSQVIDTNALCKPSPSQAYEVAASLTTDLGLGTFNASGTNESTSSQVADKNMYTQGIEHPWKVLAGKFYWQIDAIQSICQTVVRCRNGNGKYACSNSGNVWLTFLGPDKVSKKKIAASLAELVFGGQEKLLFLDFRTEDMDCFNNSMFGSCGLNYQRLKSGRKMIVDCLAEELCKRSNSVIVLENIEKADNLVHTSLLRAIKTGKFPDSHGRDINVNNVIFVLTSGFLKGTQGPIGREESQFPEENILEAQKLQMHILISSINGNCISAENVSVIPSKTVYDKYSVNKRKSIANDSGYAEVSKRCRTMIDLNLPVEDIEEYSEEDKCEDDISETMLEELIKNVDENVVFKPFDFDALAKKIVKEIDVRLKKLAGDKILLEIDRRSMLQILAAAWVMDRNGALDDWIENVLCATIKDAQHRANVTSGVVMQLLPCDGLVLEEKAYGMWLPSRIHVN